MLERYAGQQAAVQVVFLIKDIKKNVKDIVTLSDDDASDIENVLKVLESIKMVTPILCEEEHPTVSMIHPLHERLLTFLEDREADTALVKSVKLAIFSDLRDRYNFLWIKFTLNHKIPKFWDARNLCCNLPKIQLNRPNLRVFCQNNTNGITHSADPDQTATPKSSLI